MLDYINQMSISALQLNQEKFLAHEMVGWVVS